jgi:hypothetical protein
MVFDNNLFQPHLYTDFSQPPPPPPPDDTPTNKCGNEESFGEYTPNTRPGSSFDVQGQQPTRGGFRPQCTFNFDIKKNLTYKFIYFI